MKFKTVILFISILLFQKEMYADGCNSGLFTIINDCSNLLHVCFAPGSTSDEPLHTQYTWDFGDGQTGAYYGAALTICHTYSQPGTYTVTVTIHVVPQSVTCVATRQVVVTASPTLIITNPAGVCQPNTVDLTATSVTTGTTAGGVFSYWTNSTATTPLSNPTAVSVSGTYYIRYRVIATSGISCDTIAPVTVTVYTKPVLLITNPLAICSPGSVDITTAAVTAGSTGNGTLSYWTDPAATNPLVSANAITNSATYYIKTITTDGCIDIKPVTVTIYLLPISNAGSDLTICSGVAGDIGSAQVSGYTYAWLPTIGLSSATVPNPNNTTVNSGTTPLITSYTVTTTITATGCLSVDSSVITVNPQPVLIITNPADVCFPSTVDITATAVTAGSTGGGVLSYFTDSLPTTNLPSPNAVAVSGIYYIKVVAIGGCTDVHRVKVTVNPLPFSYAGSDITICSGTSVNIGTPATTGDTYSWLPTTGLSSATISTPSIVTINNGTTNLITTYTVTTTITATGCHSKDSAVVSVNAPATADAGPAQTICADASATLAGIIGGSSTSAFWGGGNGTYTPNNNVLNAVYTPYPTEATAGTVTLTLVSNNPPGPCPVTSSSITITIDPIATVNSGPDQTICIGSTVLLAGALGGAAISGTWSGGGGTYNPSDTAPDAVYTPSPLEEGAGIVSLTFTTNDPFGPCSAVSDDMVITINQLPTSNAGSVQTVCPGSTITLAGSIGGTAVSAAWSGGAGTYSPNNTNLNAIYSPSAEEYAADSVKLTLTTNDPLGPCSFVSSTVVFYFYKDPVINFSVNDSSGCPIHCVNLSDLTTVGGGATIASWIWNFGDNSPVANMQSPSHCYSQTGFYDITLTATSNYNCYTTLTMPQMIQVFPVPVAGFDPSPNPATIILPNVTMINQSSVDVNYWLWDFGDGNTLEPVSANPEHIYPTNVTGSYLVTLIVQNAYGCLDTVIHEIFIDPEFTFFIPNAFSPNADGINDEFLGQGGGIVKYELIIFDRWGNLIFRSDDLNKAWDGKANRGDDIAQIDVYVWKVNLTDVFNKKHYFIGTVTLVE